MEFFDFENEQSFEINELISQYESAMRNNEMLHLDQEALETIIEYYESMGNHEKAIEVVEKSLEQYPFSSILLLKKAELLFDIKHCKKALESLEKAQLFDPSEIEIHLLKAEILTFQSMYDEAIEVLEGLIDQTENKEDLSEIYLRLADVYEDNEQYLDVMKCLKKSLLAEPENDEALNRMNYCVEITELFQESVDFHAKLINRAPYSPMLWFNLASAYNGLDNYEKAIDALEYVIAIDELADFAYQDLAEIYFKQGNFSKALQILKDFHQIGQPDEELYFLEGQCHEAMENYKMARYCYRKALHIYPSFHEVFFKIGETYEKEDAWENALKSFTKAAEIDPQEAEYHLGIAEASLYLGNYKQTLISAQDSLDLKLNNSRAFILMIKTHLNLLDIKSAWVVLNKGKELCKDSSELMPAEAALLFIEAKRKAALLVLEEAIEINVNFSEILFYFIPDLEFDPVITNMVAERKTRP